MMGPGMKPGGKKYNRQTLVRTYTTKRLKDFNMAKWNSDLKQFQKLDLKRDFNANDQRMKAPPVEKVEEVLKIIDKTGNDENLGCKACGYNSCRDFAIDVANGVTRPDM